MQKATRQFNQTFFLVLSGNCLKGIDKILILKIWEEQVM